jgi:hypothetical protein
MSDIFHEVEEELRRERLKRIWSRSAPWIIGAVVLIIAGVSAWSAKQWYEHSKSQEASSHYQQALDLGKFSEADSIFMNLASAGSSGYAILSQFRHAAIEAAVEPNKGLERFDQLSRDSRLSETLQDLGKIRAAQIFMDIGSYEELMARLQPLAESLTNVWRHSAREMLALSSWKAGNEDAVRKWSEMLLSDFMTPRGIRGRAQLVLPL